MTEPENQPRSIKVRGIHTADMMAIEIRILNHDDVNLLKHVDRDIFDNALDCQRATEFLADPRHHLGVALDRYAPKQLLLRSPTFPAKIDSQRRSLFVLTCKYSLVLTVPFGKSIYFGTLD
jgi:hypothetical protein